ncbi:sodium:solute symporter family protein [Bradyrhizobium japonicum]|uniref:sodium:solute symporter family protein n=1 Tax=Bradyrhizobium japonicum TaxID=375 RepID=UPI0004568C1A|nr:sodium:solute symporter family protein [Bradyrhizobium japonicum]AHY52384.1 putative sodium:solute symporter [Bradyrhizobium japonicum SEMIA 5079]MCD9111691.1 sodium:solute symporter family protein [Bradyrhizobium japonicum]MCD9255699.1 sodium:solute symporter family protein [Bradyrhizobium japonicum SEMIA 5079]MCD9822793.1 sodium:solute symporter family protein [Bradyrhizobium japonicum]MCD9893570.1 sodium:solute symporter family protein [Bradyrhizobium japonicum]
MQAILNGDSTLIVAMIVAYIAFTSWLTLKLRSRTSDQFMTGARAMPAVVVGVLMMSEFVGAKSTVGTAQEAFQSGMAAGWAVLGASIGFLLFGLLMVKKLYSSGEYTISAAIAQKYGKSTMLTVSVIMIYALLLVNVGNYVSGAAAIATALHVSMPVAMCIIAVVSTFYYVFGGLKGVAWVTILHSAIKVVGIVIIFSVAMSLTGGIAPIQAKLPAYYFSWDGKIGFATIFAWTFGTVGAIFSTQFIVQAISSTPSADDARRATFYAAAFCLPLGFLLALIGVAAKFLYPDMNSLYALPVFLEKMPPLASAFVTTSLVASIFVSVCTVALAIASLVVRDFYVPYWKPTPERELKMTRLFSVAIGIAPLVFVFFIPEILKLSFFTRALRLSITIIAMMGFYLPLFASNLGATAGLIGAAISTTAWYMLGNPFGIDNMYVAAATPLVVMAVERLVMGRAPAAATTPQPNALMERTST